MQLPPLIEIRDDVMMGKPCIKGTRIPVHLILQKIAEGETTQDILSAYPQITAEHVQACFQYAAMLASEEVMLPASMKLLLDENLSPAHAERLCLAGHDALSVLKAGLSGASDPKIRAAAIDRQRILVTLDADFGNLRRFSPAFTPGIIWLKPHRPTETAIVFLLERVMPVLSTMDLSGKLAVVDEEKIRLRQA